MCREEMCLCREPGLTIKVWFPVVRATTKKYSSHFTNFCFGGPLIHCVLLSLPGPDRVGPGGFLKPQTLFR
jgi:hypothetical protein